ncbi:hypothetical protein TEA_026657 [Camellia sinensis var. sinensis]|uniref:Alpha/beta hydrolase fold-3 domain-containing protein n=1 Tax=Camellia sinensis var. sinensis TaxID=542762 RepID=A0A4S4ETY7_CAMSN|nr:hypothetical protein TEA_026657 [Camellia sinensis var. sinensis]
MPIPAHITLSVDKLQGQYMNLKIRLKEKDEVIECAVVCCQDLHYKSHHRATNHALVMRLLFIHQILGPDSFELRNSETQSYRTDPVQVRLSPPPTTTDHRFILPPPMITFNEPTTSPLLLPSFHLFSLANADRNRVLEPPITLWSNGHGSSTRFLVLSPLNSRIQRYDPIEQILFKYSHVLFPSSDLINTESKNSDLMIMNLDKSSDFYIKIWEHLRHALLCFTTASALECRNGVFSFDVLIDRETSLLIRVYRQAVTVPVIIFFHGGSFVHPSSNSAIYGTLCRRLVGICKAWVSSKPWPQSRKDSKVHIYLAGDSSGGNIVHNVAVRSIESGIEVMGNILLNPLFSGQKRTESEKQLDGKYFVKIQERDWYWRAFLPEGEDRDHPACNPFGPNGISLEGIKFPKSLVVVAGSDLIQDWQLDYAEGLKRNGQDVKLLYLEQATIGFYLLPNNEHFYTVMDEIRNFVNPELSINVTY